MKKGEGIVTPTETDIVDFKVILRVNNSASTQNKEYKACHMGSFISEEERRIVSSMKPGEQSNIEIDSDLAWEVFSKRRNIDTEGSEKPGQIKSD
eukprot:CAMPEP_0170524196 /NCGR_PEP_ID=MMETSP0209-20121228/9613_1 /TAXON_ID=665100 ORGANISM="Litonotus pictus, Strain P1" /NCGR_SAMPLE_ID=MMETSP0209 /ASSEMBLY_ACC=CAM_ASM_000301 /LENGTH=94 /DNA_ID=CAMNT_0010812721 /DNA_START=286 /DNA_END=567 /DNA_ORIENTATION=+